MAVLRALPLLSGLVASCLAQKIEFIHTQTSCDGGAGNTCCTYTHMSHTSHSVTITIFPEMSGGNVDVTVYSASGEACTISPLDNWYDTFERCRLDLFAGSYLKDCNMFEVPGGEIPLLHLQHLGGDAWKPDYFRFILMFFNDFKQHRASPTLQIFL